MNLLPRAVRLTLLLALAAVGLSAPARAQLPRNPMAQGSPPSYRCTSELYYGQPCERFLSNPEHVAYEMPNPYPWFVDYAYGAAAGFNTKGVPDSQRTTPLIRQYIGTGSITEGEIWCDPPGRALGPLPTLKTGDRLADAFFWIGGPGVSDGDCGKGRLPGGTFDVKWATQLIKTALRAAAKGKADYAEYHGIHPRNSR